MYIVNSRISVVEYIILHGMVSFHFISIKSVNIFEKIYLLFVIYILK